MIMLLSLMLLGDISCSQTFDFWPQTRNILSLVTCANADALGACIDANAGTDDSFAAGATATLDASSTFVPFDPEEASYLWTQVDGPVSVTISNAETAQASFSTDTQGFYTFQVTADWYCSQDADQVVVEITEPDPISVLDATLVADGVCQLFPLQVTYASANDDRLFVVCKEGRIVIVENGSVLPTAFLDITSEVTTSTSIGDERGFLGLAFDPDYETNGFFYVNYTGAAPGQVGGNDTRIVAYGTSAANPNLADPSQNRLLMTIPQQQSNHNGGALHFGPDGSLYIGTGDGGGGNDAGPGHDPTCGNGQVGDTLLGKMLRINVDGVNGPYTVPADNPFLGDADILNEIWSLGMRNPWRFSFDRQTGDLFIGDVGQSAFEEINFVAASSNGGDNFGWALFEGDGATGLFGACPDPASVTFPIFSYARNGGACAVVGGYVYRGTNLPQLQGHYLYADYCGSGSNSSRDFGLLMRDGNDWVNNWIDVLVDGSRINENTVGFGQDNNGEMYLVTAFNRIYRITDAM